MGLGAWRWFGLGVLSGVGDFFTFCVFVACEFCGACMIAFLDAWWASVALIVYDLVFWLVLPVCGFL